MSLTIDELFRTYQKNIVRFAGRLIGNHEHGEEIAQNTWLSICAIQTFDKVAYPKTYLFKVARNAAIDFGLRQQRERSRRVDWDSLTEADVADNTVAIYEQRRTLVVLAVSLNELPTACRQAFVMNKFEGYSHAEIAQRLGISISMVEKHIVRALLHCRNLLRVHENE